jgi:hypothetical protein
MLELITPALYVALSPGELPLGDRLRHPMDHGLWQLNPDRGEH